MGIMIHVRGTIADVTRKCPYTNDTAEVLCKRIKLFLRKIGGKAIDVNVRDARFARFCFGHSGYAGRFRINLNPGS